MRKAAFKIDDEKSMYRMIRTGLILASVFSLASLICTGILLTKNRPDKVGYVVNATLLSEYAGVKDMRVEYERKMKTWQGELDSADLRVRQDIEKFKADYNKMSKEDKEFMTSLIQQKQQRLGQLKAEIEERMNQEDLRVSTAILKQIDDYIQQYAEDNDFDYIIGMTDAGNLLYGSNQHNITADILEGLNAKYEGI